MPTDKIDSALTEETLQGQHPDSEDESQEMMGLEKGGVWTLSNLLSLSRLLLSIPTGIALWNGSKQTAVILFFVAAATDYLDGWVARIRKETSEFGRIIDPIADKVFLSTMVILMLLLDILPPWLVAVVLIRDVAILIGGIVVERQTGLVLPSNWPGKWAVGILSITILLMYLDASTVVVIPFLCLSLLLLLLSLWLYGSRMMSLLGLRQGGTPSTQSGDKATGK